MNFKIRTNLKNVTEDMEKRLRGQIPYATSVAINNTLYKLQQAERTGMEEQIDRPVSYTQRGVLYEKATKYDNTGILYILPGDSGNVGAGRYLQAVVKGGARKAKPAERRLRAVGILGADQFIVPSKTLKFDRFGNVGPKLVSILSGLGAFTEGTMRKNARMNRTAGSAARNKKLRKYFVMKGPNGKNVGIYEDLGPLTFPMPVIIFVNQPQYKKQYDFFGIAYKLASKTFALEFKSAFQNAMRTAR